MRAVGIILMLVLLIYAAPVSAKKQEPPWYAWRGSYANGTVITEDDLEEILEAHAIWSVIDCGPTRWGNRTEPNLNAVDLSGADFEDALNLDHGQKVYARKAGAVNVPD